MSGSNEKRVAARFPENVRRHRMEVLRDDGLYRHLRFRAVRDGWVHWFDILTSPGLLTINGDMFVEPNGVYADAPDVDLWDEARDARTYDGPHPVVAHPPCNLWVNFAALNYKRYGGEHNRPGNDGGCFASALSSVRRWGGVLEHPAFSRAWPAHDLPLPPRDGGWLEVPGGGWACEVWQSAYGHKARKRTWLFCAGVEQPPELDWRRKAGTRQVGWFDVRDKKPLGKKAASATPPKFRDALLAIARGVVVQAGGGAR